MDERIRLRLLIVREAASYLAGLERFIEGSEKTLTRDFPRSSSLSSCYNAGAAGKG
jgi:hypothetical protein